MTRSCDRWLELPGGGEGGSPAAARSGDHPCQITESAHINSCPARSTPLSLWPWTKSFPVTPSHGAPRPSWDQVPPSPGVPPLLLDETLLSGPCLKWQWRLSPSVSTCHEKVPQ